MHRIIQLLKLHFESIDAICFVESQFTSKLYVQGIIKNSSGIKYHIPKLNIAAFNLDFLVDEEEMKEIAKTFGITNKQEFTQDDFLKVLYSKNSGLEELFKCLR